ncbi:MAG: GyrI-like domain-containing protein [Coprobacillaceae bacterium]
MQYIEIMNQAITYMEDNIERNITVNDVANHVGYSYFHLARIFLAYTHESIGSYLKYRKLSLAAKLLLNTNEKVLSIALRVGFQSNEAFTRAFKARYKLSPVYYRKRGKEYYIEQKRLLDKEMMLHIANHIYGEPKINNIESIEVIGKSYTTSIVNNTIAKAWEEFTFLKQQISNSSARRCFGICNIDKTFIDKDGDIIFSQFISIEADKKDIVPSEMKRQKIQPGKYLIFTHRGNYKSLDKTYTYIWGTWLLNNNCMIDETRRDFEQYDQRFKGEDEESEIDIYIPIL